jgi:hypothetical protein
MGLWRTKLALRDDLGLLFERRLPDRPRDKHILQHRLLSGGSPEERRVGQPWGGPSPLSPFLSAPRLALLRDARSPRHGRIR